MPFQIRLSIVKTGQTNNSKRGNNMKDCNEPGYCFSIFLRGCNQSNHSTIDLNPTKVEKYLHDSRDMKRYFSEWGVNFFGRIFVTTSCEPQSYML